MSPQRTWSLISALLIDLRRFDWNNHPDNESATHKTRTSSEHVFDESKSRKHNNGRSSIQPAVSPGPSPCAGTPSKFVFMTLVFCVVAPALFAQARTVVPITKFSFYGFIGKTDFGSGFCLDPECRFIVTNYHVAKAMGEWPSIQGQPVVSSWLDSGPDDEGATTLGYNPLHDLALVELWRGLSKKGFHGLDYNTTSAEDLATGQDVDIYSYPLESNPKRKLLHFKGKYVGVHQDGLLVFSYNPDPQLVRGGASGGLILDRKGQIVAVLSERAVKTDEPMVLGVPVEVLSAFVRKVQPYLAQQIFPQSVFIPPVQADFYPAWIPERVHTAELERRAVEDPAVQRLRDNARVLVDNTRSLIAVQSYEWGEGSAATDPQAVGAYEVRQIDGQQRYREYPNGKREMESVPWPALNEAIEPGDVWSFTPKMIAKEYNLKIRRMPDVDWKGQKLRVFQFLGAKEDGVCNFDDQDDYVFFVVHHFGTYDCHGEVWTDQDENIIRFSEGFRLPNQWQDYRDEVTFTWIEINGVRSLVPATISSQVKEKSHVYWCRGVFTDYQQFQSNARLLVLNEAEGKQTTPKSNR
jgi:Trypsin-like peptidase domain